MNDVQKVYLILAIIWLLIIIIFRLYQTDWVGAIIILIPFIVFFANSFNTDIDNEIEARLLNDTSLTIGILLLLPILAWIEKDSYREKVKMIAIIVLALILLLLTYVAVWTSSQYIYLVNRVKSGLTTMAAILVVYVLYIYFVHRSTRKFEIPDEIAEDYDRMSLYC
jgi:hypothetical protein